MLSQTTFLVPTLYFQTVKYRKRSESLPEPDRNHSQKEITGGETAESGLPQLRPICPPGRDERRKARDPVLPQDDPHVSELDGDNQMNIRRCFSSKIPGFQQSPVGHLAPFA